MGEGLEGLWREGGDEEGGYIGENEEGRGGRWEGFLCWG